MLSASPSCSPAPGTSPSSPALGASPAPAVALKGAERKSTGASMKAFASTLGAVFVNTVVNYLVRHLRLIAAWLTPSVLVAIVLFGGGFVGVLVAFACGAVTQYLETLAHMGQFGNFLVVLTFIPVSLPFIMGYTPLTFATGYMYGVFQGTVTSFVGAMVGAILSFLGTRLLYRRKLRERFDRDIRFRGFMNAIEKHGFKIVVFMRFVPIPFGLQNGLFAVSNVSFIKYTLASVIGVLPAQLMGNYFGSTLHGFKDIVSGNYEVSDYQAYMIYSQLFVATFVLAFLIYLGKRAMSFASLDDHLEVHRIASASRGVTVVSAPMAGESAGHSVTGGELGLPEPSTLYKHTPEKLRHSMPSIIRETEAMVPSSVSGTVGTGARHLHVHSGSGHGHGTTGIHGAHQ